MLAKINELNKNVIILLSVGIIAIASIIITLIATSGGSANKGSADSLRDFQEYIVSEYGVKPNITVKLNDVSESKAKASTAELSKQLDLGKSIPADFDGKHWISTSNDDETIYIDAYYK